MEGWIRIHRKLGDNAIWTSEPFTRGQAWVDLLMLANHDDCYIRKRGVRVDVKRGEVGWSELTLCERWTWSRGKLKRFLNELEMDNQIVQQNTKLTTIISIVNYDIYQGGSTTDDTTDEQQTVQQTDNRRYNRRYRNNNDKNEKNNINNIKWRTDFSTYLTDCKTAFRRFYEDKEFIKSQEFYNPGVNVQKTLMKAYENFWGTEAGWEFKKKKRTKEINWKQTITNAIGLNKVYYTKEEKAQ